MNMGTSDSLLSCAASAALGIAHQDFNQFLNGILKSAIKLIPRSSQAHISLVSGSSQPRLRLSSGSSQAHLRFVSGSSQQRGQMQICPKTIVFPNKNNQDFRWLGRQQIKNTFFNFPIDVAYKHFLISALPTAILWRPKNLLLKSKLIPIFVVK